MPNREILFRGFHADENGSQQIQIEGKIIRGEWVYGAFIPDALEQCHVVSWGFIRNYNKETDKIQMIEVERDTVGEYIGLADKTSKKIFENDRLRAYNKTYLDAEIISDNGCFKFKWIDKHTASMRMNEKEEIFQNVSLIFEIIGTIFDVEVENEND